MPEGHTIHRAARDQTPMLAGQVLAVSSPQGRFAAGAARLDGRRCEAVEAHGKHLLYRFAGGDTLHIHLGLYGKFHPTAGAPAEPKGLVRVRLASPTHAVDINGPNRCEVLDDEGVARLQARLGPDVLRADADPALAWAKITRSRAGIGLLLMDQSIIAGLGNIYRSEVLWRGRVHPETPGRALTRAEFDALWTDSAALLARGVELGAIVTIDGGGRGKGRYGGRFNIFKKSECPRCGAPIRRLTIASRSAFCCEMCQVRVEQVEATAKPQKAAKTAATKKAKGGQAKPPAKSPPPKRTKRPAAARHAATGGD